jgi:hypothetical protein
LFETASKKANAGDDSFLFFITPVAFPVFYFAFFSSPLEHLEFFAANPTGSGYYIFPGSFDGYSYPAKVASADTFSVISNAYPERLAAAKTL